MMGSRILEEGDEADASSNSRLQEIRDTPQNIVPL